MLLVSMEYAAHSVTFAISTRSRMSQKLDLCNENAPSTGTEGVDCIVCGNPVLWQSSTYMYLSHDCTVAVYH